MNLQLRTLVAHAVAQTSLNGIGSDPEIAAHLEVVVADKVDSNATMWPKFNTSIEDFESINKAARWDYQRDRVYIRTDAELREARRRRKSLVKRAVRLSKVVVCEPLRICPRCGRRTHKFRRLTKCLHDLRFSRSGITGWVVEYQFQILRCPACRALTPAPSDFWEGTAYGRNVAAFCIFEIIELCVSQRSVTATLNRLFGFRVDEIVVRRFKERLAECYRETRQKILADMLNGNVIHADETRIRLHGSVANGA
jgi:hypothetical protein